MDIDPIWHPVLDDYNKIVKPLPVVIPSVSLRRSARLKKMQVTGRALLFIVHLLVNPLASTIKHHRRRLT
jgi:hypothetical protein